MVRKSLGYVQPHVGLHFLLEPSWLFIWRNIGLVQWIVDGQSALCLRLLVALLSSEDRIMAFSLIHWLYLLTVDGLNVVPILCLTNLPK
jgi:hypothetical protein